MMKILVSYTRDGNKFARATFHNGVLASQESVRADELPLEVRRLMLVPIENQQVKQSEEKNNAN